MRRGLRYVGSVRFMQEVYVVVIFLSQVTFVFLLFWGMVMYAKEFEQRKIKNYLR